MGFYSWRFVLVFMKQPMAIFDTDPDIMRIYNCYDERGNQDALSGFRTRNKDVFVYYACQQLTGCDQLHSKKYSIVLFILLCWDSCMAPETTHHKWSCVILVKPVLHIFPLVAWDWNIFKSFVMRKVLEISPNLKNDSWTFDYGGNKSFQI